MASTKASTLPDVISYKTESKIKFQKSQQVSSPAFHFRVEKREFKVPCLLACQVLVVQRVLVQCWLCAGCWCGAGLFHRALLRCYDGAGCVQGGVGCAQGAGVVVLDCFTGCWCGAGYAQCAAGVVLGWCWVSTGHRVTFESQKATERNGPAAAGPGPALGHFRIMVCSDSEVPSWRSLTDSSQVSG